MRDDEVRVELSEIGDIDLDDPDDIGKPCDEGDRLQRFADAIDAVFDRYGLEVVGENMRLQERPGRARPDLAARIRDSQESFEKIWAAMKALDLDRARTSAGCLHMAGRVSDFLDKMGARGRLRTMRTIKTPVDLFEELAPGALTNIPDATVVVSDHIGANVTAPLKIRVTACFASDTALQAILSRPGGADQTILFNGGDTLGAGAGGEFGLRVKRGDTVNFQITVDGALRLFTVDLMAEGAD